jgi:hypothetical protein
MDNLVTMVTDQNVIESLTLIFNNPFKIRKEFFESSFAEIVFLKFFKMIENLDF